MKLDIADLKEIDSPVMLDDRESKYLFFYYLNEEETSVEKAIELYVERKGRSIGIFKSIKEKVIRSTLKSKLNFLLGFIVFTLVILFYSLLATGYFLSALNEGLRTSLLPKGYQWFSEYENLYILSCLLMGFSMIFLLLIIIIVIIIGIVTPMSSKKYSLECLRYRQTEDYIVKGKKGFLSKFDGFYFKALDFEWDLHRLFAIDSTRVLALTGFTIFLLNLCLMGFSTFENNMLNDPTTSLQSFIWVTFIFSKIGIQTAVLISISGVAGIFCLIYLIFTLSSGMYKFTKIKNHVLEAIETKLFLLDAFVSKPTVTKELSDLDHLKVLQLQNKLYRVMDNIKRLPIIPITNWNLIIYGVAIFSALYSFFSVFLEQLLKIIFVN